MILMLDTANVPSAGSCEGSAPGSTGTGVGAAVPWLPPRMSPRIDGPAPGGGAPAVLVGAIAGGRLVSWTITVIFEASTPGRIGSTASPRTLPVFWFFTVRSVSLNCHCTRVTTRCCSHGSGWPGLVSVLVIAPGTIDTAVIT